jgi:predicted sulfurtransferase
VLILHPFNKFVCALPLLNRYRDGGYWAGKNYTFDKRFAHGALEPKAATSTTNGNSTNGNSAGVTEGETALGQCALCACPWDRSVQIYIYIYIYMCVL